MHVASQQCLEVVCRAAVQGSWQSLAGLCVTAGIAQGDTTAAKGTLAHSAGCSHYRQKATSSTATQAAPKSSQLPPTS